MRVLINRQDAIDALTENKEMINAALDSLTLDYNTRRDQEQRRGQINEDIETIKALPSAQPEPSTEIQEILNYLDTTLHPIVSPDNWNVYSELHDMVSRLPSAQPEIIHCRDCKHHHYESKGIPYCDRIDYGYGWKDDDFCSRAERRTDEGD